LKKYLLATVLGICSFSQKSSAYPIALTTDGNIPSHVILDTRPIIFRVQSLLRGVAPAIKGILNRGESLSGTYMSDAFSDLNEGSFPGLAKVGDDLGAPLSLTVEANPSVDGDVITVYFNPSHVNSASIPPFKFTFKPHKDAQGNVINWTCKSYLNDIDLGITYIRPNDSTSSAKVLDPITLGLGWPYDGCETPDA